MAQALILTSNGHPKTEQMEVPYEVPPLVIDEDHKVDDNRKRRFSVSAESSDPKNYTNDFKKKVYPKTDVAMQRIRNSVSQIFLWRGLDREQQSMLIDAMFEKKVVKEEYVIRQGDRGDYFYVVESGVFEVWKSPDLKKHVPSVKVFTYKEKGAFGELALMYNAPRAASVKALTDGILWAVDGETFRHIIVASTAKKRARFDDFLQTVSLFTNVPDEVRSQIADVLEVFQYEKGDYVIRKGDNANHFYLIQDGTADVTIRRKVVRTLRDGDYFGERALLLSTERSANVIVASKVLRVVAMDKASFLRLIENTSAYQKLRRHMRYYIVEEMNQLSDDDNNLDDDDY